LPAKVVVWAHNSHLGDARATETAARGEFNVGQLVREQHPADCRLIGFTTYAGTVTAADDRGGPAERKSVRPALPGSIEELFHQVGQKEFLVAFHDAPRTAQALRSARLERAIGVICRPRTESAEALFPGAGGGPVRRRDPHRRHPGGPAARANSPLGAGEVPETYPWAV